MHLMLDYTSRIPMIIADAYTARESPKHLLFIVFGAVIQDPLVVRNEKAHLGNFKISGGSHWNGAAALNEIFRKESCAVGQ
jgi:hypothetical protein